MARIEWVRSPDNTQGITANSKTGCLNHINGLCKGGDFPCYAYKLAHGRLKQRYLANEDYAPVDVSNIDIIDPADDPFYPRFWPERLDQITSIKKPTGIFLDDMSDWMGDYWPEEWTKMELQVMKDCPQHRFYTLTKQPQNLPHWNFPENCWVGFTATTSKMFVEGMNSIYKVKVKVIYISFEPLLEWHIDPDVLYGDLKAQQVNLLIIGACTGTKAEMTELVRRYPDLTLMPYGKIWTAQPIIEWVNEICEAVNKAGISVFLKNNLKPLLDYCAKKSGVAYRVRQEMPEILYCSTCRVRRR